MTAESKTQTIHKAKVHWRKRLLVLCIPLLLGLIALCYFMVYERFCPGIKIYDIDVGGKTLDEAEILIDNKLDRILNHEICLVLDEERISIPLYKLGLKPLVDDGLAQGYLIGKQGPLWERMAEIIQSYFNKVNIDINWHWHDEQLEATLKQHLQHLNRPSRDATFTILDNNLMNLQAEEVGRNINYSQLMHRLKNASPETLDQIEIPIIVKDMPQVTKAMLEQQAIDGLLASYSTIFDHNLVNRTHNIRLAAQALDKTLIPPGATFSFNDTVGPRTYAAGYREAIVIVNNQFVPGLGGGICQVSSTLYNAFLYANLEVIERQNHTLAIDYVPLGQDATVAYPYVDLKVRNTSEGYLYLRAYVEHNQLTVDVYGHVIPNREVRIKNITEVPGRILTYRIVTIDGQEVQNERISRSVYY